MWGDCSTSDYVCYSLDGFNQVFPLDKLRLFSPEELQLLLSGEQVPEWSRDDIVTYTEPKYGYTRDSPGFQRFVHVLAGMDGDERKVSCLLLRIQCR